MIKLTSPSEIQDTVSQVDTIINQLEVSFRLTTADEWGSVKISVNGHFSEKDNHEVVERYKSVGWKSVSFQKIDLQKTRWIFKK
jgi:hypothetical protein